MRLMPKTIRMRITLWHLAVLSLTILLFMLFSQLFLWKQLHVELKNNLVDDLEMVESYLEPATGGKIKWRGHEGLRDESVQDRWVEVCYQEGELIFRNFTGQNPFALMQSAPLEYHKHAYDSITTKDGDTLYGLRGIHQIGDTLLEIRVARSDARLYQEMGHLFLAQILCFPIIILIAWAGGYFISGRMLNPLKNITRQAQTISAERLHERLPVENPDDELGQLSITVNAMLTKLDHSFTQIKQFTADASHELRTPLTAIRTVGETALRTNQNGVGCRDAIASILEEVEKMTHLVDDLLIMARADSMTDKMSPAVMDLGVIAQNETALFSVLAEEKNQQIILDVKDPCPVLVDQRIFRLAAGNILHNAIKYTPESKDIRISVWRSEAHCCLEIADEGPGIRREHQQHIFDRFYRVDKDRSRNTGGSGLGLSIAKWAAEINGGRIQLISREGHGSAFRIWLPIYHADHKE